VRVGLLTGGVDCPGLNAAVRAVVQKGERHYGDELVGFREGWRGGIEGQTQPLGVEACRGILARGGTILGTSRTDPYHVEGGVEGLEATVARLGIDALIAIGGVNTLGVAHRLGPRGLRVVGVPKTIENDVAATELTFGFHTAVQTATDAIDRLHTTAQSHDRVMVCEVMGRHAGWLAAYAGIAGGATAILIPEERFDIGALADRLQERHRAGRWASIVVVAEGARPRDSTMELAPRGTDTFGHMRLGGVGRAVAEEIERRTGLETRSTVLGHLQRGGTPTAFDRVLATRFGVAAIEAVHDDGFDEMIAVRAGEMVRVALAEAAAGPRLLPIELYDGVARAFFN